MLARQERKMKRLKKLSSAASQPTQAQTEDACSQNAISDELYLEVSQ